MKLPETVATENELLRQQVRTHILVNGYLSAGSFVIAAYAIYKIVGIFL